MLLVHSKRSNDDILEPTHTTTNKASIKHVEKTIQGSLRYRNIFSVRKSLNHYSILISVFYILVPFVYLRRRFRLDGRQSSVIFHHFRTCRIDYILGLENDIKGNQ